jgi:phospholipase D1/2
VHPNNPDDIIFPGQDYNNARIYDFQDVVHWKENKLDRTKSARMGWSDLSICLQGSIIEDLRAHFVQRWNFIYNDKYSVINERHYAPLTMGSTSETTYRADGSNIGVGALAKRLTGSLAHADGSHGTPAAPVAYPQNGNQPHHPFRAKPGGFLDSMGSYIHHGINNLGPQLPSVGASAGKVAVQLVRSSARWSHGIPTEVSHKAVYISEIGNMSSV